MSITMPRIMIDPRCLFRLIPRWIHILRSDSYPIGQRSVLTGKPFSAKLALSLARLLELRACHGKLEDWWFKFFGFDFSCLTESEARYLIRTQDADTIRDRIVAAEQTGNS
jgi:hypothetical protein